MNELSALARSMSQYYREPDSLGATLLEFANELDRLQAIIDWLPTTADGVPILPDSIVWLHRQRYVVLVIGQCDCLIALADNRERRQWVAADRLYSNSEAEEKGRP